MKRCILFLMAVLGICSAASAQLKTSYFMEGSYFRTDLNPALTPIRGYFSMPALGGVKVSMQSNFLSVNNFLYKNNGQVVTFMHNSVDADTFLKRIPNLSKMDFGADVQLMGFGAYNRKKTLFWNFGMNLRTQAELTLPKELFSILKSMDGGTYDLSDTHIDAMAYTELFLGFAMPVSKHVTIGFRVKGLFGMGQASGDIDNINVKVSGDEIYADLSGTLRATAPVIDGSYATGPVEDLNNIINTDPSHLLKNINNGGAAIDLGVEVRLLNDHLKLSGAVTDLGFIYWHANSTAKAEINGEFSYRGVNLDTNETVTTNEFGWSLAEPGKNFMKRLNCALNIGAEYNILDGHIAFGVLSHTKFCQSFTYSELTASANFRAGNWFTWTLSHTFLGRNRPGVFGTTINFHPAGFNLFLGADYIDLSFAKYRNIPIPRAMKSINVYFGLGFNFGKAGALKAKSRNAETNDISYFGTL